ncbi:MAG: hypothetical protein AMDU4_FER2C00027G0021 [Ferroplasma sp. Type II]|uniref:hypothetical protein n=1 Tax=Ferroplasma sp. Type II TaxID=261388 RepID=UPI0003895EE1|nr:hypothetical protein [Ferroplasma sp. Type II]EQB74181.1 MAG: hypothetical protein AMDU4_FER2C00027G0021 [Ferroplasma sp. Type II]
MKNKMPMKYRIILVTSSLSWLIIMTISFFTPYNLMENPLISYGMVLSMFAMAGVDIYVYYLWRKSSAMNLP